MILLMIDYNNILKTIYITPCNSAEAYSTERALASVFQNIPLCLRRVQQSERDRSPKFVLPQRLRNEKFGERLLALLNTHQV